MNAQPIATPGLSPRNLTRSDLSDPAVIQIEGVSKQFNGDIGPVDALDKITLSIQPGDFVVLLGASGCGKTTLLRVIAGLDSATRGRVLIDGTSSDKPRKDVGFVFQAPVLLPYRTVLSNVLLPAELHGGVTDVWVKRAYELLRMAGLESFAHARPGQLSGGMRQRVAICRSLLESPRILLMDEPFGALDAMTRDAMNEDLHRLWRATGMTVVFVTHDIAEAVRLGTRIVVLSARPGRLLRDIDCSPLGDMDYGCKVESVKYLEMINKLRAMFKAGRPGEAQS